jgi:hypothetical protein
VVVVAILTVVPAGQVAAHLLLTVSQPVLNGDSGGIEIHEVTYEFSSMNHPLGQAIRLTCAPCQILTYAGKPGAEAPVNRNEASRLGLVVRVQVPDSLDPGSEATRSLAR